MQFVCMYVSISLFACFWENNFLQGLAFHHGDILHVVNAGDREWWQARSLMTSIDLDDSNGGMMSSSLNSTSDNTLQLNRSSNSPSSAVAIIPSCQRIERRQRIRSKRVNFMNTVTMIGSDLVTLTNSNLSINGLNDENELKQAQSSVNDRLNNQNNSVYPDSNCLINEKLNSLNDFGSKFPNSKKSSQLFLIILITDTYLPSIIMFVCLFVFKYKVVCTNSILFIL